MTKNAVELRNVSFTYAGFDAPAIDDASFAVAPGECVVLCGESGCGKTTTLRMIGGFIIPDEGRVIFEGKDITALPPDKRHINTVFQKYSLFSHMSVADNIAFGLKLKKKSSAYIHDKIKYALKLVDLEGYEDRHPMSLSGGQQQRIAIARAIVNEPKVLLLDEPLGALDALTRLEMQELIVSLWQEHGFTVLLVTHDVSEAVAMADRVLLIEEKKIGLDLSVDIPRPRRTGSAKLAELEAEVLDRVMKRGSTELQRAKANA